MPLAENYRSLSPMPLELMDRVFRHVFDPASHGLDFDRNATRGMRLNIPAGTSVRFEPGEEKEVHLVEFAGERLVLGHKGRGNQ